MTTTELRDAAKAKIPDARVANTENNTWTIRFSSPAHLATVRDLIKSLNLRELYHDVEGSRWGLELRVPRHCQAVSKTP